MHQLVIRNTPTCVGKTAPRSSSGIQPEKHPHVRGEDTYARRYAAAAAETPPRAWGRRKRACVCESGFGNTPTCVGKTTCSKWRYSTIWKHPHVRGEDIRTASRSRYRVETPPRAWGRQKWRKEPGFCDGNTPTCVGKTLCFEGFNILTRKHPHVRGEDVSARYPFGHLIETPPRAWGRHQQAI